MPTESSLYHYLSSTTWQRGPVQGEKGKMDYVVYRLGQHVKNLPILWRVPDGIRLAKLSACNTYVPSDVWMKYRKLFWKHTCNKQNQLSKQAQLFCYKYHASQSFMKTLFYNLTCCLIPFQWNTYFDKDMV